MINSQRTKSTSFSSLINFPSFVDEIDKESLTRLAIQVRTSQTPRTNQIFCEVKPVPKAGPYNIVFELEFSDNVKWVARIPITYYTPALESHIRSDVDGMRFLHSNTCIPIPFVYDFDATPNNSIGRPYMFLSSVKGQQLAKLWFDPEWFNEARCLTVFRSLAFCMSQLSAFEFPEIGRLARKDSTGEYFVAPIYPSLDEIREGTSKDDGKGPYASVHAYLNYKISRKMLA